MKNIGNIMIGLLIGLVLLSMSAFTVDQREFAMVFRLGEIVSVKKTPGLYFKVPLVENVRYFEKRIMTLDWVEPDRFITSEKKNERELCPHTANGSIFARLKTASPAGSWSFQHGGIAAISSRSLAGASSTQATPSMWIMPC